MAHQDANSFVESVVDTQKKVADAIADQTRKFANGNPVVEETVQKSTDWYKNWLDNQKKMFGAVSDKSSNWTEQMQQQSQQASEYYKNWLDAQMNMAKQAWEAQSGYFNNAMGQQAGATNPMQFWNNMQQQWNNWMNQAGNTMNWMSMMQQWQNMFSPNSFKSATDNWSELARQYQEILSNNWSKMQEYLRQGTAQDAYKNMINATEGFSRFHEMWAPMWKSIQDKTFNTEMYKQWMNPAVYKEFLDKYLGLMPEGSKNYMQQMTAMGQDWMKQMNNMGMQQFQMMRNMGATMPGMNPAEFFNGMMNGYNQFYGMMTEAAAPFNKMVTPNQITKAMNAWQDISNRMAIYNIRNAELQYMMYQQGVKVMDQLAENVQAKIQSGEEINSIMNLFQEWMNISDKTYVALFESDEYSKLMAEVSAMQLRLKKDIELQMEQFMSGVPVATRSEMDELYKTIYELKKRVRDLEKTSDNAEAEADAAEKTAARKTTKK